MRLERLGQTPTVTGIFPGFTNPMLAELPLLQKPIVPWLIGLALLLVVGATGWRTFRGWSPPAKEFNWEQRGHSDFHYGTYVPAKILLDGGNPYTELGIQAYPIPRPAPPFSPAHFLLHSPLVGLGLPVANILFFTLNASLLFLLGWLACRFVATELNPGVFLLVALLVFVSRPGHQTLFTGYFTAELAVGTALALHFARTRPMVSGLGLFVTSFKPTFFVPLVVLMFFRRDFRAAFIGCLLTGMGVLIGLGWMALSSSPAEVIEGFLSSQQSHESNPDINPATSWVRTDLLALLSKPFGFSPGIGSYLLTMVPIFGLPCWILWRQGDRGYRYGASGPSGLLICLTMLVGFYHSVYDGLILIPAWVALTFYGFQVYAAWQPWQRISLIGLTALPAVSYFGSMAAKTRLNLADDSWIWHGLTMSSGLALFTALIMVTWIMACQESVKPSATLRQD